MLIQALTDHFQSYFKRAEHYDTVLWFDPGQEYAALLDHLTEVPLWRYQGSLLELRYRLIQRAPGERTIVYLPLRQEEAEVLRPFFATSLIFRDRLYRFLRRQGLDFPDDPQVAHELRELLPRLAARSVGKGRAFWEYNLANLERARETLLGNFDDALLRFLAQPQATLTELRREKLDGLFFAQLESAYGLAAVPEDDPRDVAHRLTAQLALVRAFTGAGQPHDFPYTAQLPAPLYFERCQAFLDRWQRDSAYKAAYIRLADGLEKRYNLAGWAAGLPASVSLGLGATFLDVEMALWTKVEAAMAGLESEADWRAWLGEYKSQFKARAASFWAQEGRAPGWGLLARAADLLAAIQNARQELDRLATPEALLRRYANDWWRIDHDFRVLREALDVQPGSYDRLRDRCARSYREILRRMNDRFCTLLEAEGRWPSEALPAQDAFWAQAIGGLKKGRRLAIVFVDALRYELGQELQEALEGWFNFPGKYVDTFRTLKKSGRLDGCGGAHQSVQDFLQGRGIRHSGQFQRAVPCPLAPLKLVVIPEQLQQGQQPPAHPPVNLQVRAQPTLKGAFSSCATIPPDWRNGGTDPGCPRSLSRQPAAPEGCP